MDVPTSVAGAWFPGELFLEIRTPTGTPMFWLPLDRYTKATGPGVVTITPPSLLPNEAFTLGSIWIVRKYQGKFYDVARMDYTGMTTVDVGATLTIMPVNVSFL